MVNLTQFVKFLKCIDVILEKKFWGLIWVIIIVVTWATLFICSGLTKSGGLNVALIASPLLLFLVSPIRNSAYIYIKNKKGNKLIRRDRLILFICPFLMIIVSMVRINTHIDGSYVWITRGGKAIEAPLFTFHPKFWKVPTGMIVRDNNFGRVEKNENSLDTKPIWLDIVQDSITIRYRAKGAISRERWEEFNFNEKKLRAFIQEDIKKKISTRFKSQKQTVYTNLKDEFAY